MKKKKIAGIPKRFSGYFFICIVSWELMADTMAVNGESASKKACIFSNELKIQAFCF